MSLPAPLVLLVLVSQALDGISTLIGWSYGHLETNPLIGQSPARLILAKSLSAAIVLLTGWLAWRTGVWRGVTLGTIAFVCGVVTAVAIKNIGVGL